METTTLAYNMSILMWSILIVLLIPVAIILFSPKKEACTQTTENRKCEGLEDYTDGEIKREYYKRMIRQNNNKVRYKR